MQQKTAPADRAQALLRRFTSLDNHHAHADSDGYCCADTFVGRLVIYVDVIGDDLSVSVQDLDADGPPRTLLRLSCVQDDDLVASIIRQVIDQHNGKQVV